MTEDLLGEKLIYYFDSLDVQKYITSSPSGCFSKIKLVNIRKKLRNLSFFICQFAVEIMLIGMIFDTVSSVFLPVNRTSHITMGGPFVF
ncbi:hypothetical protein [Sporosarcina sp. 6E9]|uniref:hypothetical protein n=1 Tax=Sporosarcina sp. 6E9 TaxID=2819235 RepID=UPI001B307C37|nr:hypothetical protein [Sporosarcina sp. 6E9]